MEQMWAQMDGRMATDKDSLNSIDTRSVSVIICAYTEERWDELTRSVQAVRNQQPAPSEIVLVIDHNPALLKRASRAFPGVQVVASQEARGLSGARNTGVKAASGDILVFIDEDAWPQEGWLARLVKAYADPSVLGVGGGIDPDWSDKRPAWFPDEFLWVVGCTYRGMPTRSSPIRNLIGANMSFRCSAFEAGGFNLDIGRVGSFPAGGEETEFSIRLRQQNPEGVLLYQPEARVWHRVPPSRGNWAYFASRCYAEGQSKALVTSLVGSKDGLGSERFYSTRTLPLGVLHGVGQALRGDLNGLRRSAAIVGGLGLTTAGYLVGKLRLLRSGQVFPATLGNQRTAQQKDREGGVSSQLFRGE
jgi:glycosyltransferase involved in cell wall biosynthesis